MNMPEIEKISLQNNCLLLIPLFPLILTLLEWG